MCLSLHGYGFSYRVFPQFKFVSMCSVVSLLASPSRFSVLHASLCALPFCTFYIVFCGFLSGFLGLVVQVLSRTTVCLAYTETVT